MKNFIKISTLQLLLCFYCSFNYASPLGGIPNPPVDPPSPLCEVYQNQVFDIIIPSGGKTSDYNGLIENKSVFIEGDFYFDINMTFKNCIIRGRSGSFNISSKIVKVIDCQLYACVGSFQRFFILDGYFEATGTIFDNVTEAIHLGARAGYKINNCIFKGSGAASSHMIHISGSAFGEPIIGCTFKNYIGGSSNAIFIDNCCDLVSIGASGSHTYKNVFFNVTQGILIRSQNKVNIINSIFLNNNNAITINSGLLHTVEDVTISNTIDGIICTSFLSTLNISKSNFNQVLRGIKTTKGSLSVKSTIATNISKYFINSIGTKLEVDNCHIYNSSGQGIIADGGIIKMNTDTISLNGKAGVKISNSMDVTLSNNILNKCMINNNNITSGLYQYNSINGLGISKNPVESDLSFNGNYCSNTFSNYIGGVKFSGNCDKTSFVRNELSQLSEAVQIDEVIGKQTHHANIFSNITGNGIVLTNTTSDPFNSQFIVNSLINANYKPTNWAPIDILSDPQSGASILCKPRFLLFGGDNYELSPVDELILDGYYLARNGSLWEAKKRIMKKAYLYPTLLSNQELNNFYIDPANSDLFKAARIELLWNNFYNSFSNSNLDFLNLTILNEEKVLDSLYNIYLVDLDNSANYTLYLNQRNYLNSLIHGYDSLSNLQSLVSNSVLLSLFNLNSSISASIGIPYFEKVINELMYDRFTDSTFLLTHTELNFIHSVSSLCPLDFGSIVYSARSFLSTEEREYYEDTPCQSQFNGQAELTNRINKLVPQINIYPNPTNGLIHLSNSNLIKKIKLSNFTYFYNNIELINGSLDLRNMRNGLYLLEIELLNGNHEIKKIVIEN